MKKTLAIVLSFLVALTFSACSNEKTSSEDSSTQNKNASELVKLCKYKNVEIDWESTANAKALTNALSGKGTEKKTTSGKVKSGDKANIDYVGKKDGVAFSGGTAEGYDLTIGSGQFIEGFEEGLIGVEIGDTVDLNLTFPESYHSADLAGADVVFTVTVNYVTQTTYTDEDILSAKNSILGDVVIDYVMENSTFKEIPESMLKEKIESTDSYYRSTGASQYGSFESFLSTIGLTEEQYNSEIKTISESQVKQQLLFEAIAEKEGISVDQKEYTSAVNSYAKMNSQTASEFEAANGRSEIESVLLSNEISTFLEENNSAE